MLKKFLNPDVKEYCPNCRQECSEIDILCPKCGENLDELFEKFPDSEIFTVPSKWKFSSINKRTIFTWRVINTIILVVAFLSPWEVVYSDLFLFGENSYFTIIGVQVFINTIPISLPGLFQFDCTFCMSMGLIATGYLSLTIYAIMNFVQLNLYGKKHHRQVNTVLCVCAIISILMILQTVTPIAMVAVTWGYWLACIGLFLSLCLEYSEWRWRKSFSEKSLQNPA